MRIAIKIVSGLFALFSTLPVFSASLMAHDVWIPEMPPVSRVHAGFAGFHNMSATEITITGFSSTDYERIEMHLSREVDGMARMIPQKTLVVQANKMLMLKHGSYHLMMFNPKRRLKQGDEVELIMHFADGTKQTLKALVKKSNDSSQLDHSHHTH